MNETITYHTDIPDNMIEEWQSIVDLIARIAKVRAALIMRVTNGEIEVFVSSKTKNSPYVPGNKEYLINSGLYCERVIKSRQMLSVPDASKSDEWRNNPDMKYNMKCYLGFPVRLPNGNLFGTICMLDDKENDFSQDMRDFMEKMRNLIESYLKLLHLSITDQLTGLYTRTYFNIKAYKEIKRTTLNKTAITILLVDIDHFKKINDTFGHPIGDEVLKNFSRIMISSLRNTDIIFRFGGDEFIILMPDTVIKDAVLEAENLRLKVENSQVCPNIKISISIGAVERIRGESLDHWLVRVDKALYQVKKSGGNQVIIS
ncbi:MAG: sensor domain-containing diguanylate cyclase [Clostridium sp.]|uniref:sensor domain-containing diguanylate cyclase n=2 Tax=Clostridium sp. TaxID=1506 RepID=UPI0025BB1D31|nr:sensor domain-containing diguanylate cyclase [Clostridium sp.]MCH3963463.1 sensor domain-containing diguanylate cyclase [Clostridium sp.]MCI1801147.1 sensor domain-containing diguanylate cyclase [Clostridium sp.]